MSIFIGVVLAGAAASLIILVVLGVIDGDGVGR